MSDAYNILSKLDDSRVGQKAFLWHKYFTRFKSFVRWLLLAAIEAGQFNPVRHGSALTFECALTHTVDGEGNRLEDLRHVPNLHNAIFGTTSDSPRELLESYLHRWLMPEFRKNYDHYLGK